LAGTKENALKRGQTIVFVDKSGFSERPPRVRTWAPRGQIPVLQYGFSRHQLSAIAGVTFWQFYFPLSPGSIKGTRIVESLSALTRQLLGPLPNIRDSLRAHKSKLVHNHVQREDVGIQLELLPAYTPELNPAEYLRGCLKTHDIGNLCSSTPQQISDFAIRRRRSMQRRPTLVIAFWKQAELPL
jgi:transposase